MKRLFDRFSREWTAALLLTLFITVVLLWDKYRPASYTVQFLLTLLLLALGIPFIILWRRIWRERITPAASSAFRRMFVGASRFLMRIAARFDIFRRYGNRIDGKTTVKYDLYGGVRAKKRERTEKPLRWRDMKTERERLGFLYYRVVTKLIRRGERVRSSETPQEIRDRFEYGEAEERIVDMYVDMRYDGRKAPTREEIDSLRRDLGDKFI